MPWGGRVTVQRDDGAMDDQGAAERMSVSEDLWRLLSEPEARSDLTSAQVHFALAPEAAARIGRTLSVDTEQGLLTVSYTC